MFGVRRSSRQDPAHSAGPAPAERPHADARTRGNPKSSTGGAADITRALDWLVDGVALVRHDGSLAYANAAMQAILRRGDGIRLHKGAIQFTGAEARGRFRDAIDAAGLGQGDSRTAAIDFIATREAQGAAYVVSVRPLGHASERPAGAVAIVSVRDPHGRRPTAVAGLREILGITEA